MSGKGKVIETDLEDVDPSLYRPIQQGKTMAKDVPQVKETPKEDPCPMDIREYLEKDRDLLKIHPMQEEALCRCHQGKILPYNVWKVLVNNELTRRVE